MIEPLNIFETDEVMFRRQLQAAIEELNNGHATNVTSTQNVTRVIQTLSGVVKTDGTEPLIANWNAGQYKISAAEFEARATGTGLDSVITVYDENDEARVDVKGGNGAVAEVGLYYWDTTAHTQAGRLYCSNQNLWLRGSQANSGIFLAPGTTSATVYIGDGSTTDFSLAFVGTAFDAAITWVHASLWLNFDRAIKSSGGRVSNTTRVTNSTHNIAATDEVIFYNTDSNAITANLPAGVEGRHYKLINCGSSGNDLSVNPNGAEQIYKSGAGVAAVVADGEVLDIHYNAVEGWW